MINTTINKIILSATTAMFLTACGGGGSTPTLTAAEIASAKIQAYAVDGTNPAPTVADYAAVGITVTEADLTAMNALVDDKTDATEVDEVAELEALLTVLTADTTAPVVTPVHPTVTVAFGGTYVEAGATVTDDSGEVLTATPSGTVDVRTAADYTITYTATDSAGNVGTATTVVTVSPEVIVADTTAPVVTPVQETVTIAFGGTYVEAGATVTDDSGEVLTATPSGTVDVNTAGDYTITYTATDSAGNVGTATTVVTVSPRFTIEDANVSDTLTGLVWDKTASTTCTSPKTVPTVEQFQTIIDYKATTPAVVAGFDLATDDTHYKTSDNWDIRLKYGIVTNGTTATDTVCVDATNEVSLTEQNLTRDDETNEVTDPNTGLVWKDVLYGAKTKDDALTECATHDNMRLPTVKELNSIYDRDNKKTVTPFATPSNAYFWTSEKFISTDLAVENNWVIGLDDIANAGDVNRTGLIIGKPITEIQYFYCVKK